MFALKALLPALVLCCIALSQSAAQLRPAKSGVDATLNSESFGYRLTCVINGHDTGFKGGGQDALRFVGENRYLHLGRNTVVITYAETPKESHASGVNVQFTVPGYPAPLFYAHAGEAKSGRLEGVFDIAATPPQDFKPLYLSEYPSGAAGFLYLDQDAGATGDFTFGVDGNDDPTSYSGRLRYAVPLPKLHAGVNKVAVTFDTHGGPLRLFVVGPTATSSVTLQAAQKTTRTFPIVGVAP